MTPNAPKKKNALNTIILLLQAEISLRIELWNFTVIIVEKFSRLSNFGIPNGFVRRSVVNLLKLKKKLSKPRFKPKVCKYCEKTFIPNTNAQIFCSPACTRKFHNEKQRGLLKDLSEKDTEYKKSEKPKTEKALDNYAREADECGLSYGKYKLQLKLGKTYEELKAAHLADLKRREEF